MQNTGLAVVVGLSSHFLSVLGMVLMKDVHLKLGSNANSEIQYSKLFKQAKWRWGLFLLLVGGTLYPISLGLGPITLTSALSLSTIPFNMVLSYKLLEDTPSLCVMVSSLVVCVTLGLGIANAPPQGEWHLADDAELWRSPEFLLWTVGMIGLVIILWLANKVTCKGLNYVYGFKVAVAMIHKGICSAYIAILGKLAVAAIDAGDDTRSRIYAPAFVVLCVVPLEFPLRQRCIASTDMTKALPTMVVSLTLFTVPTGGIFFKEFDEIQPEDSLFFASIMVAAVVVLLMNWCAEIHQIISPEEPDHGVSTGSRCLPGGFSKFTIPGLSSSKKGFVAVVDDDKEDYTPDEHGIAGIGKDSRYSIDNTEDDPAEPTRTEIEMCVTNGTLATVEEEEEGEEATGEKASLTGKETSIL